MKRKLNLQGSFIHPRARRFIRGMQQVTEMLDKGALMEYNRKMFNRRLPLDCD